MLRQAQIYPMNRWCLFRGYASFSSVVIDELLSSLCGAGREVDETYRLDNVLQENFLVFVLYRSQRVCPGFSGSVRLERSHRMRFVGGMESMGLMGGRKIWWDLLMLEVWGSWSLWESSDLWQRIVW
jgi:hypothetical protein